MRTKIFLSALVLALFLSAFSFESSEDNNFSLQSGFTVYLIGPGATSSASVRMRSQDTGIDYYGTTGGSPGTYNFSIPDGSYDIFVCTNYPSFGATYNVKASSSSANVYLSAGECPYGD